MTPTWAADKLVTLRKENVNRYKRNFLRQAVCEFRFPTLMELGMSRPPASFVAALRKEYPYMEQANEVTLTVGSAASGSNSSSHIFRSSKMTWSISLKESAFSIETNAYTEYAQLRERATRVIEAAAKIIDSDFFTRVGLRYINIIDCASDPFNGWVNPDLVTPILSRNFNGINEYAGKIQLGAPDGGCLLQHGLRIKSQHDGKNPDLEYMLDIDSFRTDISVEDAGCALDAMHSQAFSMFDWAIGEKSREYLSADKSINSK